MAVVFQAFEARLAGLAGLGNSSLKSRLFIVLYWAHSAGCNLCSWLVPLRDSPDADDFLADSPSSLNSSAPMALGTLVLFRLDVLQNCADVSKADVDSMSMKVGSVLQTVSSSGSRIRVSSDGLQIQDLAPMLRVRSGPSRAE